MNLGELMRIGDVKRWHTVRTALDQTLADHSARVALIALRLYWYHTGRTDNADIAALLTTALLHDAAEVHLGDPPPAGKTTAYVAAEVVLLSDLPPLFKGGVQNYELKSIVKVADRIEAWLWIRENAVGNHSLGVVDRCYKEMERMAADCKMTGAAMEIIEEIAGGRYVLCPF